MRRFVASVAIVLAALSIAGAQEVCRQGSGPRLGRRRYRQHDRRPHRLDHRRWPRSVPRDWRRGPAWRPDRRILAAASAGSQP